MYKLIYTLGLLKLDIHIYDYNAGTFQPFAKFATDNHYFEKSVSKSLCFGAQPRGRRCYFCIGIPLGDWLARLAQRVYSIHTWTVYLYSWMATFRNWIRNVWHDLHHVPSAYPIQSISPAPSRTHIIGNRVHLLDTGMIVAIVIFLLFFIIIIDR